MQVKHDILYLFYGISFQLVGDRPFEFLKLFILLTNLFNFMCHVKQRSSYVIIQEQKMVNCSNLKGSAFCTWLGLQKVPISLSFPGNCPGNDIWKSYLLVT